MNLIERLQHQALLDCMAGKGRYLDCLGSLVKIELGGDWDRFTKSEIIEMKEILLDFEEYDAKMREAGMR